MNPYLDALAMVASIEAGMYLGKYLGKDSLYASFIKHFKDSSVEKEAKKYYFSSFLMPTPLDFIKLMRDELSFMLITEATDMKDFSKKVLAKTLLKKADEKYWTNFDEFLE